MRRGRLRVRQGLRILVPGRRDRLRGLGQEADAVRVRGLGRVHMIAFSEIAPFYPFGDLRVVHLEYRRQR